MAGDWIKFELATPDKPEVWAIAASLSIDPDAVVGKLLRVWGWFDQQTENGNAPSVSKMLLDRLVGVTGFCKAVIDADWMHDDGVTLSLPHFDRHNGKTAKNRATTAKRVASFKNKTGKSNATSNDEVTPAPLPKEEKRREENILKDITPSAPTATPKKIDLDYSSWPSQPSDQVMTDWLAMRKRLKANVSQTVINRFATELHKARTFGYTVDQCLAECVTRNWRGFEVQWMQNSKQPAGQQQYKTAAEKEAERNAYTFDLERARNF
jgi:chorismate mutase